jgi:hypothetical protein
MWKSWKNLMSRIRRTPASAILSADDDRLVISRSAGEGPCILWWREVDEIQAFKRDVLITDEIRLAFRVGDAWHDVSEGGMKRGRS